MTLADMFTQRLDNTTLPRSLRDLTFGRLFNNSLDKTTLPDSLQTIVFGTFDNVVGRCSEFDQSLDNTTLPSCLENLTFGACFNQSLDNTRLPSGLKTIEFGLFFNQSLDKTTLPSGLETLMFGDNFNQNLDNIWAMPSEEDNIIFNHEYGGFTYGVRYSHFNQSLDNTTLPSGLLNLASAIVSTRVWIIHLCQAGFRPWSWA